MSAEPKWYAIYTRSRHEKRTYALLNDSGVEAYLPLVRTWRIWSDRKKQVEVPLFSSYLFVRTAAGESRQYLDILNTPGVVRFITFEGKAVPVPDHQIHALQRLNKEGVDMECMATYPPPGTPVMVTQGPMKGLTGEVITVGKNKKVVLRLDTLDKCVTLNIPLALVAERKTEAGGGVKRKKSKNA